MDELTMGDFLRKRRASVAPSSGDLRSTPARRVSGLRREEVARRVGVSVDYYVKLEQGRRITPSDAVLTALADVLQLDDAAREHLQDLARRDSRPKQSPEAKQQARVGMLRLMESLGGMPAVLLGRRTNILAANRAARFLVHDFNAMPAHERNALRFLLFSEKSRLIHRDWETAVAGLVGMLRMECGRHPNDPRTAELVDELSARSGLFRQLWADRHVARKVVLDTRVIDHPDVGPIRLHLESVHMPEDRDQTLHVLIPASDSASQAAMRHLQQLVGTGRHPDQGAADGT
ncbi:helix-turn-helix transcriptional regulator [Micromonospora sp. URMC 103]|uniref:helix-turn-helix transcriptional regulator n=1 Tax=Micromonospora sp. URMC 103 TaxID=3423406 RepID=UPI003F1B1D72